MSDNVIQFGRPAPATENEQVDEAREELNACVNNLIEFLNKNKPNISHFVAGVATAENSNAENANFHLFTSRISAADFALALAMMNKALTRYI